MGKLQYVLRFFIGLTFFLLYVGEAVVNGQTVDPRMERIRQDLGYYKSAGQQQNPSSLADDIRALRKELNQTREQMDSRLQQIEEKLKLNVDKQMARQPQPVIEPKLLEKPSKSSATASVCSEGCDFNDLQKAVDTIESGGTINVAPEISGTCAVINKPLHIIGKRGKDGRRAHLAGGVCIGKAPLVTTAQDIIIEGLEISNVSVGDGNGACIRLDSGTRNLTVRDIYCHDSQDGLLGESKGLILIENSSFIGNGFDEGHSHGLYLYGDEIVIRGSRILSTQNAGHSLKSGARKLTVEDSVIAALNSRNSRALDAYGGGEIVLLRNVIHQGPNSDNSEVIGLANEPSRLVPDGHSLRMENNWVIFDEPGRGVLVRGRKLGPITVRDNTFVGLKGMGLEGIEDVGNRWIESRKQAGLPPFDGTVSSLPEKVTKK